MKGYLAIGRKLRRQVTLANRPRGNLVKGVEGLRMLSNDLGWIWAGHENEKRP